jgi:dTDP-4-amino-4,6-dideoxygalactose transaminase
MRPAAPIRLLVPRLPDAGVLLPYLRGIDERQRYANGGPLVAEFERRLGALVGLPAAACVASGTAALELALRTLRLPPGAGVALPAFTFPATAIAVLRAGLRPVFLDIDPATLDMQFGRAHLAAARGDIAAAVPVPLFGCGIDARRWGDWTQSTGLPVVVDAAGAIGFQEIDPRLAFAFSLHATKPLASGEGGFVASADASRIEAVRRLANFGFADGAIAEAGMNAKMSEYHAAIGLASLDDWPRRRGRYETMFGMLRDGFAQAARCGCAIVNQSGVTANLVIRAPRTVNPADLERFVAAGIETRRWYWPPLHRHGAFSRFMPSEGLPETDAEADRMLGVPWHLELAGDDLKLVCATLADVLA